MTDPNVHEAAETAVSPAGDAGLDGHDTASTAELDMTSAVPPSADGVVEPPSDAIEATADEADVGVASTASVDKDTEHAPAADGRGEDEAGGADEAHDADEADDEPTGSDESDEADAAPPPVATSRTVGRLVAEALRTAGVKLAFTVPGESFLGLLEGLTDAGIRVVATRHESAAAFMAEAYGQLTGRPAACLATRGVGASNLAIGIHTAMQDSTAMFALVGQVEREFLGREAFQEVDQVQSFGRLAKWSAEIGSVADVPVVMGEAVRQALGGRPGPVLVSVPEDLLDEIVPDGMPARAGAGRGPVDRPEADLVRSVLHLLAGAKRPLILAGGGVLRARGSADLLRFAELLGVPVVAGWRRGDVFPNEHPLFLGMAGFGAPEIVRERIAATDALLVIGSRLGETTTFGYRIPGPDTRWAHVDVAPRVGGDLPVPSIVVTADAKAFLKAAVARLEESVLDAESTNARAEANAADRAAWLAAATVDASPWSGPGVHPGRIITTLRRVLPDEAILTTDAGNFSGWLARGFRFRKPGTFLGPTSGAMGYGLPAAIAAAIVHRDRPVVALAGDGGFAMTMAELETAVRENARVVVLVFDNGRFGTIRMWQDRRGRGQGIATDLGPIDFGQVARACGARSARVERDDQFEGALRTALAADRPTVIHLTLDPAWVSVDEIPAG